MNLKKSIFFLIFFPVFLYGQKNAVSYGNFKEELALRKTYHSAQVASCQVYSNENEADVRELIRMEVYDREGKIIKTTEFQYNSDKERNDSIYTVFSYDNQGRLAGYSVSYPDGDGFSVGYSYNSKNELTYCGVAAAEAREFSFEYKKGLLMHQTGNGATQLKTDGTPDWVKFEETFFEYNKQKQRTGEKYFFLGNPAYTNNYEYDKEGRIIKEKIWFGEKNGEPGEVITYVYNKQGLLTESRHSYPEFTETREYILSDW
ncbi:MAG: hypothetical protein K1X92_18595 [Bacteroidia bacterium]|nr:hypothetical protein [Bacteroidia bacterium]